MSKNGKKVTKGTYILLTALSMLSHSDPFHVFTVCKKWQKLTKMTKNDKNRLKSQKITKITHAQNTISCNLMQKVFTFAHIDMHHPYVHWARFVKNDTLKSTEIDFLSFFHEKITKIDKNHQKMEKFMFFHFLTSIQPSCILWHKGPISVFDYWNLHFSWKNMKFHNFGTKIAKNC